MLSVELFEFYESMFEQSKVNILTSGYCKKSISVHVDLYCDYLIVSGGHNKKINIE